MARARDASFRLEIERQCSNQSSSEKNAAARMTCSACRTCAGRSGRASQLDIWHSLFSGRPSTISHRRLRPPRRASTGVDDDGSDDDLEGDEDEDADDGEEGESEGSATRAGVIDPAELGAAAAESAGAGCDAAAVADSSSPSSSSSPLSSPPPNASPLAASTESFEAPPAPGGDAVTGVADDAASALPPALSCASRLARFWRASNRR